MKQFTKLKDLNKAIAHLKTSGHNIEKVKRMTLNNRACFKVDEQLLTDYQVIELANYY